MERKRTDTEIREEIIFGLENNPSFDPSDIKVHVHNSEVFLSGFVDSWESRRSAHDIASNVSGVIKVHSKLELRPR